MSREGLLIHLLAEHGYTNSTGQPLVDMTYWIYVHEREHNFGFRNGQQPNFKSHNHIS